MKMLAAGTKVSAGYYLNLGTWEFTHLAQPAALPAADRAYLKAPMPLVLVVAPVFGLLMVMFLPFIGFALTIGLVARKVGESIKQMVFGVAAVVHPAWRPGEAYLTGKRHDRESAGKSEDAQLDALASEIAARREQNE